MSRLFFSSLSGVDYGGSINPLSLNPTVYFQTFDTSYLTPSSPSFGAPITEIRQYTAETYTAIPPDCAPVWGTLNSSDLLYFYTGSGGCWPPPCTGECNSIFYEVNQNINFMSTSGYSFTLYFVAKPLSGVTNPFTDVHYIFDDAPENRGTPRTVNVERLVMYNNKDVYLRTETSDYNFILDLPIEVNSDVTELESKNLRVFSVRAKDTGDLVNTVAYSYVNGIQTTAITQSVVTTSTTTGLDYFSIGGISEIGTYDEQYTGYFGELIIFNEFHSLSTHNSIVNFLKERWGIT